MLIQDNANVKTYEEAAIPTLKRFMKWRKMSTRVPIMTNTR